MSQQQWQQRGRRTVRSPRAHGARGSRWFARSCPTLPSRSQHLSDRWARDPGSKLISSAPPLKGAAERPPPLPLSLSPPSPPSSAVPRAQPQTPITRRYGPSAPSHVRQNVRARGNKNAKQIRRATREGGREGEREERDVGREANLQ